MSKDINGGSGVIDFLIKHSKKIIITLVAISLLVCIALTGAWWYTGGNKVVATLGDKKVLKTEYDDAKVKCDAFYKYNKDDKGKKNCSQSEIEDQILKKALEIEAEKRNITVTEAEVNARYKDLVSAYKSEDSYKMTIKTAYGWTPDYVKTNLKRDILKEKLSSFLINYRDVYGVFVRYDWSDDGVSAEQTKADETASREMLEKNLSPLVKSDTYKRQTEEEIIKIQTQKRSPWDVMARIGTMDQKRLNTKTAKDRFKGSEDWAAILKLQKVGDTTDVIRSSGGYFVIYRLESIGEGKFSDWEEFTKDVVGKAKINSISYKYNSAKRATSQKIHGFLTRIGRVFGVNPALAGSTCDYGDLYGWIADGSNTALRINGVSLDASEDSGGDHGKCSGARPNLHAESVSWVYGGGGFKIGNAGDSTFKALDCHVGWKISVTKSGYQSLEWRQRLVKPNGGERVLDARLRWDAGWTGESYSGPEGSCNGGCEGLENTNGDGLIIMQPNEYLNNFDQATCNVVSGWTLDFSDPNYQSLIHIYQTPTPTEWDPNGGYLTKSLVANGPRPDVASAYGITNGNHGFSLLVPDELKDGNDHYIWAYAWTKAGGLYMVGGAPKKISTGNCTTITSSSPVCTFSASSETIKQGYAVTLSWAFTHPENIDTNSIHLWRGTEIGPVLGASGSRDDVPLKTTDYDIKYKVGGVEKTCGIQHVEVKPNSSGSANQVAP